MKEVRIALVAAVAKNGVIGAEGGMPWRLPSDLRRFKQTTLGNPGVMGRKTHESIGKALPGRPNIVVTRDKSYESDGISVVHSVEAALDRAREVAAESGADEIHVIGGGTIYREAMPLAEKLYITHVDAEPEGDTHFPPIDPQQWHVVHDEAVESDHRDTASTRFVVYERTKT